MEFRETLLAAQRNQQEKASVVSFDFHFATYRGVKCESFTLGIDCSEWQKFIYTSSSTFIGFGIFKTSVTWFSFYQGILLLLYSYLYKQRKSDLYKIACTIIIINKCSLFIIFVKYLLFFREAHTIKLALILLRKSKSHGTGSQLIYKNFSLKKKKKKNRKN